MHAQSPPVDLSLSLSLSLYLTVCPLRSSEMAEGGWAGVSGVRVGEWWEWWGRAATSKASLRVAATSRVPPGAEPAIVALPKRVLSWRDPTATCHHHLLRMHFRIVGLRAPAHQEIGEPSRSACQMPKFSHLLPSHVPPKPPGPGAYQRRKSRSTRA